MKFIEIASPPGGNGGVRRLAWWDWGGEVARASGHVVVCVHGLSRQGRDFDELARALAPTCRVVAVDVTGRGHSDWLADPMGYQVPTYAADALALMVHLREEAGPQPLVMDWVGTSMGGLIGLGVAAQPEAGLRRLVLNDVGPAIRPQAIERIGAYLGRAPAFDTPEAGLDYLWGISTGFGPHTPEQWRDLNLPMLREREGRWHLHYDPAIARPIQALLSMPAPEFQKALADGETALWAIYDALRLPTLLLRGADSDLLDVEVARSMTHRGPCARLVEFSGVGHAPTLVAADQVAVVRDFLLERS